MANNRVVEFDFLRFPLAVIIVAEHVFDKSGMMIQDVSYDYSDFCFFMDFKLIFDAFFRGTGVPMFFLISGYLFFWGGDFTISGYFNKLKKRIKTLLIPYVLWNLAAIILILLKQLPLFEDVRTFTDTSLNFTAQSILSAFWMYDGGLTSNVIPIEKSIFPINIPLWYLRDLMVVVFFSPIVYIWKTTKTHGLILLGLCWLISTSSLDLPRFNQLITAFFFFTLGANLSIRKDLNKMNQLYGRAAVIYVVSAFVYVIMAKYNINGILWVKQVCIFTSLITFYNVARVLIESKMLSVNTFVSSSSFFIYVSHGLICNIILKFALLLVDPSNGFVTVITYMSSVCICVVGLLGTYFIICKYLPMLAYLLTGRKFKS